MYDVLVSPATCVHIVSEDFFHSRVYEETPGTAVHDNVDPVTVINEALRPEGTSQVVCADVVKTMGEVKTEFVPEQTVCTCHS